MRSIFSCILLLLALNYAPAVIGLTAGQAADKISALPGQPKVNFSQYSGYVTVNSTAGRALFYWLVEAAASPETAPLLLFLTGGPGSSSIAYGAFEEIGPFRITPDGQSLYLNPYSWNQGANLLFIDSPAGVGFSYSNTSSDLTNVGDSRTGADSYVFLLKWFERLPQYKHRDFYIVGDSYSGHYVPQLAQIVYRHNKGIQRPTINLKGIMVGNGVTDEYYDNMGAFEYWWTHGLISDETLHDLNEKCVLGNTTLHTTPECDQVKQIANQEFGNIDAYSIYSPICNNTGSLSRRRGRNSQLAYDPCIESYSRIYFNRPEVQKAYHANITGFLNSPWNTFSATIYSNWGPYPKSVLPIYRELIAAGFKIWVFSGDADAVVPITGTRYCIAALNLTTVAKWYPWYDHGEVGGWSQVYKGLTFVSVRGGGHLVPLHSPRRALILFRHFLLDRPMPTS